MLDLLHDPCTDQRPLNSVGLSTLPSNPFPVIGGRIPRCLSIFNSPHTPHPATAPHQLVSLSHCRLGGLSQLCAPSAPPKTSPFPSLSSLFFVSFVSTSYHFALSPSFFFLFSAWMTTLYWG